jgi:hypothetical protein
MTAKEDLDTLPIGLRYNGYHLHITFNILDMYFGVNLIRAHIITEIVKYDKNDKDTIKSIAMRDAIPFEVRAPP